jgi:hypothetical protein
MFMLLQGSVLQQHFFSCSQRLMTKYSKIYLYFLKNVLL